MLTVVHRPSAAALSTSDFGSIRSGSLLVWRDWIDDPLLGALRDEVRDLDRDGNSFTPSGVATAGVDGAYGSSDRRVCVLSSNDWTTSDARRKVRERLNDVCAALKTALQRPSLHFGEAYFSISSDGASLKHHMDERHEETKGSRGWDTATRRSVSWLLYLNPATWNQPGGAGAGGEFQAYCRRKVRLGPKGSCGAHKGNLQVGWLYDGAHDTPVFLDSWLRISARPGDEWTWRPASGLFTVDDEAKRQYLTNAFTSDSESWLTDGLDSEDSEGGMSPRAFAEALRAQLPTETLRAAFSSVEDDVPHARSEIFEVAPLGGTLLLFDSVAVPHSVLPTTEGDRIALAGWFHEDQQEFPDWYGT